jgi:riboflavin synthase
MFTGIVPGVATVRAIEPRGGDVTLVFDTAGISLAEIELGGSIAVSGVCLTVVELDAGAFSADVSNETLSLTTLGALGEGSPVNLEPALRIGDPLGGHLMSGHVDGIGRLLALEEDARSWRMRFEVPAALARYVARKGSIAIDGISLTVNEVEGREFGVNIIPHTFEATTLGSAVPGRAVNIEVDQIARYVERLAGAGETA